MKHETQIQFGDFQTPVSFAREITSFLRAGMPTPSVVVEPTCGSGSFLTASVATFGPGAKYYGFDVSPTYVAEAMNSVGSLQGVEIDVRCEDFYLKDWRTFFRSLNADDLLVIGNPPWVTNSGMGSTGGANLPEKSNFQGLAGYDAKTGKANFDISEWMLIKLLDGLKRIPATLAMLCNTKSFG